MNIDEIRNARRELENHISDEIQTAVNAFRERTGLSPSAIVVDMIDVTQMGERERQYVVGRVRAAVDL